MYLNFRVFIPGLILTSQDYMYYFSIHVRRTDKVSSGEAAFHHIDEYMKHAEEYFDNLEDPDTDRRVYIATDDLAVIYEAKQK